ncbi:ABC transporter permease [Aquisalibacillus elongatus]|uniref:ABC-2 type transport system permease protein n=1 Tax=Aquisalibacillus elongatus TaxID=485577 RepID=A0A3N5B1D7_9BACI|nr:ABC transporter permease [Aquisalibacillus elongatus]RPF51033.1 ABC-2 type transport system permease protein [Aquisalibacillus elongatus]
MRNSLKVARWEFKRNVRNKTFIISLFITPLIFLLFASAPTLLNHLGDDEESQTTVYLNDQIGVYEALEPMFEESELVSWDVQETPNEPSDMTETISQADDAAYIILNEETLETGTITYMTSDDLQGSFENQLGVLQQPIKQTQLQSAGLSQEQLQLVQTPIEYEAFEQETSGGTVPQEEIGGFPYESAIPAIFAGLVLFSIVISGMMIFQSASQEKKDKVAEIILSSVTTSELMQGKIWGYFSLGILQVAVWITMALPIALWRLEDVPVLEYLFVPETLLLTFIAVLGYLLFAALFVGLGATIEDYSTSGNFQGMVMMLPFLPFIFIGPIFSNPEGIVAQIGTYIPFTSPAVLIMRLSILDEWPWVEMLIGLAILIVSIWIFMKLAGKIFQIGILIYGKNATPQEIWKWLRA